VIIKIKKELVISVQTLPGI